jgi:uncharacterized membrane protein YhaH (DUF805 family)
VADEPSRRGSDSLASLLRVMALWTGVLMLVSLIDTVIIGEGAENWWHGEPVLWASIAVMALLIPWLIVLSRRASAGVRGTGFQAAVALALLIVVALPGLESKVIIYPAAIVALLMLISLWRWLRQQGTDPAG